MMKKALTFALPLAFAVMLAACTKSPETPPSAPKASNAPPSAPAAQTPGTNASAPAPVATANPDAAKDPVFNMPAKPVLDVSKSKAEFDKIVADVLK